MWADNDYRAAGRTLRVTAVDATHATCTVLTDRTVSTYRHPGGYVHGTGTTHGVGRTTRIRIDRFRPTTTGYRLVSDVPTDEETALAPGK